MAMIKPFQIAITDIEGDGLYDTVTQLHCTTVLCCTTGQSIDFLPHQMDLYKEKLSEVQIKIGHNVLDFDGPAIEKVISYEYKPEDWFDTLVLSRLLYPDLLGGHSLGMWGTRLGTLKIDWRQVCIDLGYIKANDPKGEEFKLFRPEMVGYCNQDCKVNLRLLQRLMKYAGFTWETLLELQQQKIGWK